MDGTAIQAWGMSDSSAVKLAVNQAEDSPRRQIDTSSITSAQRTKATTVLHACRSQDLDTLITLATTEHGLVDDEVRQTACMCSGPAVELDQRLTLSYPGPLLLGYSWDESHLADATDGWRDLPPHKNEDQVALDVNRSFIYYPKSVYFLQLSKVNLAYQMLLCAHSSRQPLTTTDVAIDESDQQLDRRKVQLSDVIIQVLRLHPCLNYFQGFHDIAQVFLLVLGQENAVQAVAHVSLLRIRDFMLPSISPSLAHLQLLPAILFAVDPKLHHHLSTTRPFFALAATLTLYAHDIQEYADIARLFDFLLAQPAVASVYLFVVIIQSRRSELFEISADEPEMLHFVLSKLPKPLNLEELIVRAMALFREHPPETLPWRAWSKISRYSVLKSTRAPLDRQSIMDGETLFAQQAAQLNREQFRQKLLAQAWRYRRPFGTIGVAVSAVILSYWLRKHGLDSAFGLGRIWDLIKSFRF